MESCVCLIALVYSVANYRLSQYWKWNSNLPLWFHAFKMNALSIHPKKKHLGLYFGLPSILMDKVRRTIYKRQQHKPVLRVQKSCQQLIRNYHECPEILCNILPCSPSRCFKCTWTVYFRSNKHFGTTALLLVLPFGSDDFCWLPFEGGTKQHNESHHNRYILPILSKLTPTQVLKKNRRHRFRDVQNTSIK